MTTSAIGRSLMLEHLERELVGPAAGSEATLGELPISRYSAAILYPVGTEFADEPADFSGGDEDPVTQTAKYYPSACGLSFVLTEPGELLVRIGAAVYSRTSPGDEDGEVTERGTWVRRPLEAQEVSASVPARGELLQTTLDGRAQIIVRARPARGGIAVTVALVNTVQAKDLPQSRKRRGPSRPAVAENSLYEVKLAVRPPTEPVAYASSDAGLIDREDQQLAFTYRSQPTYAVGHGAAADWWREEGRLWLGASFLPHLLVPAVSFETQRTRGLADLLDLQTLGAAERLSPLLRPLAKTYEAWSATQLAALHAEVLSDSQRAIGLDLVDRQMAASRRIAEGIQLLDQDDVSATAFRLANQAMLDYMTRPGAQQVPTKRPSWRAFQLAFALMVLPSLVDENHECRELVDLLWFPTGGGKTEAYLFLTAFETIRRRLVGGGHDPGVVVLSRYTLRLLTTQQFQRAAALACALERLRDADPSRLGADQRFAIGLFVGQDHSPNSYSKAKEIWLPRWTSGQSVLPTPECPWCATPIVKSPERHGITAEEHSLTFRCLNPACPFHRDAGLPIEIVDEGVFRERPSMVIATVDKLASLPVWSAQRARLLGGPDGVSPSLVLQDELHLLNGPLGTTASLYEIAIQAVMGAAGPRPKVIASTATIRRAADQSAALFGRAIDVFPPSGVSPSDSFFAETDGDERTARVYVGVMTVGNSWQSSAVYTLSALMGGVTTLPEDEQDPYWTSVVYTNSLDDHGRVSTLVSDDVRARLRQLARAADQARQMPEVAELRGAGENSLLIEVLRRLAIPKGSPGSLDCVITTNLIQVGIDVQRLGLIAFVGQPKSTSEYIQASSRVGRAGDAPGLIVTLFNHARARDRSHYESFRSFHQSLYRWVEPMSVTPFSTAALDRLLPAVFAALARHGCSARWQPVEAAAAFREGADAADFAISEVAARAGHADCASADQARQEAERLAREWDEAARATPPLVYSGGGREHRRLLNGFGDGKGLWNIQTSMRSVEEEVPVVVFDPAEGERRR